MLWYYRIITMFVSCSFIILYIFCLDVQDLYILLVLSCPVASAGFPTLVNSQLTGTHPPFVVCQALCQALEQPQIQSTFILAVMFQGLSSHVSFSVSFPSRSKTVQPWQFHSSWQLFLFCDYDDDDDDYIYKGLFAQYLLKQFYVP